MTQFWASMSPILASRPTCHHRKLPSTGYRQVIVTNYTNFIQDNENSKGVLAKEEGNFFAPKQKVYYLSVLSMIFLQIFIFLWAFETSCL
jgi:hypothetical protein